MPWGSGKTFVGMKIVEEDWIDWRKSVLCIGSKICFEDVRVTTDPEVVQKFIEEKGEGPKLILSTYHSAINCLKGCKLDLFLLDEAHYAGGGGIFSGTLFDSKISADKRVFTSSTPRAKSYLFDLFGDVVYNLPYKEATERNITTRLKLIAYKLKDQSQAPYIPDHNTLYKPEKERELKTLILAEAWKEIGFRKVITFSRNNKRAKGLWEALEQVEGIGKNLLLNTNLSSTADAEIYGQIRAPVEEGDVLVVNYCRLLPTGVDVPDCDCVYLADQMNSEVNILQTLSRASRRAEGKTFGYVLIPVRTEGNNIVKGEEIYANLVRVIEAMATQDSAMMFALSNWVQRKGEDGEGVGDGDDLPEELLRQIVFPEGFSPKDLKLSNVVLNVIGDFDYKLGVLKKYKEEFGDVLVPHGFEYHRVKLISFVMCLRANKRKGRLSTYKQERLDDLGFVWDPLEDAWNEMHALLERYIAEHGDASVPQGLKYEGVNMGKWVARQRERKKAGIISQEQMDKLDACEISWDPFGDAWDEMYALLKRYIAEHGDASVPDRPNYYEKGLGAWVSLQRKSKKKGKMPQERIDKLDALGFKWGREDGYPEQEDV